MFLYFIVVLREIDLYYIQSYQFIKTNKEI